MAEESYFARLSRLFTDGARGFLQNTDQKKELDLTTFHRNIQPVVLVGRNVTSDTQPFDVIFNSNGRLLADAGGTGTAFVSAGSVNFPSASLVGDIVSLDSGNIAGNLAITIPTLNSPAGSLWELLQFLYTAKCDATVATRTPIPKVISGMTTQVLATATTDFIFAASLPSLTASEEGRVFVPRAPALIQLNDNGVITTGAASPLPMLFDPFGGGLLTCTLTAGVAGDIHRITAWFRRVA